MKIGSVYKININVGPIVIECRSKGLVGCATFRSERVRKEREWKIESFLFLGKNRQASVASQSRKQP